MIMSYAVTPYHMRTDDRRTDDRQTDEVLFFIRHQCKPRIVASTKLRANSTSLVAHRLQHELQRLKMLLMLQEAKYSDFRRGWLSTKLSPIAGRFERPKIATKIRPMPETIWKSCRVREQGS